MARYEFRKGERGVTVVPPSRLRNLYRTFVVRMKEVYDVPVSPSILGCVHFGVGWDRTVVDPLPDEDTPYGVEFSSPLFFTKSWDEYLFLVTPFIRFVREREGDGYLVVRLSPTTIKWILPFPLPSPSLLLEMDPVAETRTMTRLSPLSVGYVSRALEFERRRTSNFALSVLSKVFTLFLFGNYFGDIRPFVEGQGTDLSIREEEDLVWTWINSIITSPFLVEEKVLVFRKLYDIIKEVIPSWNLQSVPSPSFGKERLMELVYHYDVSLRLAREVGLPVPSLQTGKPVL